MKLAGRFTVVLGLVLCIVLGMTANAQAASANGVWDWGDNYYGELGDGTTTQRSAPVQVSGLGGVTAIAGGDVLTIALKSDGAVWAWGCNYYGELGDGTTTQRLTPVQVSGLSGVTAIAGGYYHTIALKSDGTVWAWGNNGNGQLGDGTTTQRNSPVQVSGLTGVTAIAGGNAHTIALKPDGTVWAWGYNGYGQLGDGTTTQRLTPVQVSGLSGVTAIAGGAVHTIALKSDGTVWAWGNNGNGQLGDGTTTQRNSPVQVSGLTGVTAIAGGNVLTIALKSDGTVWAWGYNGYGQLGDGTTTQRNAPVQVSGLSGVTAIAGGAVHTIALKSDGTVWAWGWNNAGQLGDGTTTERLTPVQVSGLAGVTAIAGGYNHSIALVPDTTPPTSAITAPTSSDHPTGGVTYNITGTATDNTGGSGVQKVEVSTDGGNSWTTTGVTDTSGAGSWATWSYNWTLPLEGTFTIKSRATDMEGNVETPGAGVTVILVDKAPPVTTITAPANGAYIRGTSYNITGTSSDATGIQSYSLYILINGGFLGFPAGNYPGALTGTVYTVSWSQNWTLPADGTYTITAANARDSAGNIETPGPSVTVTVDNTPPVVSAGVDKTANSVFTQVATATDANPMTYQWSKVSGPGTITFGTQTASSTTVSASADGTYSLQFTATDAAGNSASSTMTLTWDATAPSSLIAAPSGPYVSGASCNISGTASDTVTGVQMVRVGITPDGGTTTWYDATGTTSWSYPWTFPADGSYSITSRATDNAGNVETPSAGVTVAVDNTVPASSLTAPAAGTIIYGASTNVTGTAADTGPGVQTVEVGITPNGGTTTWYPATGTTSWNYPWTLPADGSYKIQTRATDKGNHVEVPAAGISVTVDNSSPVITGPVDHAHLQAQFAPDPTTFSWFPNACVKFKVAYSARPDFKKKLTVVSDNRGIGVTYNPSPASWNKITALGGNVFWRVVGTTAARKVLNSASQQLVIDGTYSDILDIPSTDVNSIPTMECDPGAGSSVRVEFSSNSYFVAPLKTSILTPGSPVSYTPTPAAWRTITKLGPEFYWRFMGKLSTGETSYSVTNTTSVTGGPTITDPADGSTVIYPLTISWDTTGFVSFVAQASATPDFSTKVLVLGSSKTGSLELTVAKWSRLSALGNPVYLRVAGTTEDRYTAYGPAVKVDTTP